MFIKQGKYFIVKHKRPRMYLKYDHFCASI